MATDNKDKTEYDSEEVDKFRPESYFGKGNQLWKLRATTGIPKKFEHPDLLIEAANKYFEWAHENPMVTFKPMSSMGVIEQAPVVTPRILNVNAMCLHIGVTPSAWYSWRKNRPDLLEAIEIIEAVIKSNKYEGAAANIFNANIVAKDLGLTDKAQAEEENTTEVREIEEGMSPKEASRIYQDRLKGLPPSA